MPRTKGPYPAQPNPQTGGDNDSTLNAAIQSAISQIPQSQRYLIGLSGGLDSLALIHFCIPYLRQFTNDIQVIHVHHGLSQHADQWASFCMELCQAAGLDCIVERVQVVAAGEGLEAAARKARYQVFSRYMQEGTILLLGHHLNDQAETLLMRFLKGLGPAALRGMARERPFSGGSIFRPWLSIQRRELELALALKPVASHWIEDESNLDRRFERNFLRHDILPLLLERRPSVLQDLQHSAMRCADYVEFVEQWCRQHASRFFSARYVQEQALDLQQLKSFTRQQQAFILRYWFDVQNVAQPSEANFTRIMTDMLEADSPAKAEVIWKDYCVRAFDAALFCFKAADLQVPDYAQVLDLKALLLGREDQLSLMLPAGELKVTLAEADSNSLMLPQQESSQQGYVYSLTCCLPEEVDSLLVRSKKPGERIRQNAQFTHSLKKLYQSHRVLPWHRAHLPIIEAWHSADERVTGDQDIAGNIISLAGFVAHPFKLDSRPDSVAIPIANQIQADATASGRRLCLRYLTRNGLPA